MPVFNSFKKLLQKQHELENHIRQQAETIKSYEDIFNKQQKQIELLLPVAKSAMDYKLSIETLKKIENNYSARFVKAVCWQDLVDKLLDWELKSNYKV